VILAGDMNWNDITAKDQHGYNIGALDALRSGGGDASGWHDAWQVA